MYRTIRLLLVAGTAVALLAALAGAALAGSPGAAAGQGAVTAGSLGAARFAPYQIPPQVPPASSPAVRHLLRGSAVTAKGSWIIVHLRAAPTRSAFRTAT